KSSVGSAITPRRRSRWGRLPGSACWPISPGRRWCVAAWRSTPRKGRPAGNTMRILIATTHRGLIAGTAIYLAGLIPALRARGHELAVIYQVPPPSRRGPTDPDCPAVPAWAIQPPGCLEAAARRPPDPRYLPGLG